MSSKNRKSFCLLDTRYMRWRVGMNSGLGKIWITNIIFGQPITYMQKQWRWHLLWSPFIVFENSPFSSFNESQKKENTIYQNKIFVRLEVLVSVFSSLKCLYRLKGRQNRHYSRKGTFLISQAHHSRICRSLRGPVGYDLYRPVNFVEYYRNILVTQLDHFWNMTALWSVFQGVSPRQSIISLSALLHKKYI